MSTTATPHTDGKVTPRPLKSKSPSRLFRKLTTRLKPLLLHPKPAELDIASPTKSPIQSPTRRSAVPIASTDHAAVKRRQAALQQCGLVPLHKKDLSQLEAELDRRFSHVVTLPQDQQDQEELSSAEKIRREWQVKNETQPGKQGHDLESKDPSELPSDPLSPDCHSDSDPTRILEDQKALEHSTLTSSDTLPDFKSPVSLSPIQETFPDLPEEDVIPPEIEKKLPEAVDPLTIPLPDSPLSSSTNLPDLPPSPTSRESKRPPPIVVDLTTNDTKDTEGDVPRGRSTNRDSLQSLASGRSLPALSPTMTASSSTSLPTPRDEESRERMEVMINRTGSVKSRSSRLGKASDIRRDSEDLHVVPENPELSATESKSWNPNRESNTTMGSAGFEAFVEKRERRRKSMSTGIFQPARRSFGSGRSSRKSASSDLSSMWSAIAADFALKPLEGSKSRSSTLPTKSASANELAQAQSQAGNEQPQSKISRSKSVIASLGLRMTRKSHRPVLAPSPPPSPMRQPTVKIVENRETIIREVKGIEDDESRRLTELAFMDF